MLFRLFLPCLLKVLDIFFLLLDFLFQPLKLSPFELFTFLTHFHLLLFFISLEQVLHFLFLLINNLLLFLQVMLQFIDFSFELTELVLIILNFIIGILEIIDQLFLLERMAEVWCRGWFFKSLQLEFYARKGFFMFCFKFG
jgi:hypothetical protein